MAATKGMRHRTLDAMPTFSQQPAKVADGINRSLFHYTTAAGLIGIIKSQSLFATHANFLNDSGECRILRHLLKPQITAENAKLKHRIFYGASEIFAGIYVLSQNYPQGRGAFSSGFNDGFQIFRWNVVLVSTLTAVYIMVRGLDNVREGLKAKK